MTGLSTYDLGVSIQIDVLESDYSTYAVLGVQIGEVKFPSGTDVLVVKDLCTYGLVDFVNNSLYVKATVTPGNMAGFVPGGWTDYIGRKDYGGVECAFPSLTTHIPGKWGRYTVK